MKRSAKWAWAAAVATLLATALAACGSSSSGSGKSSSPGGGKAVTITMGSQQAPTELNPLLKAYEKLHPGTTIKVSYGSADSYPPLVQTELQAGNAPDVIQTSPGTGFQTPLLTLGKAGRLIDLSSASWTSDVPTVEKPLVQADGKTYGYPTDQAPQVLFYNPDIFKKYGLSLPTTYTQLLTTCKALSSKGVTPIILPADGTAGPGTLADLLATNLVYAKDPNWNTQRAAGKVTFAGTAGWNQVLLAVTQMKASGCFASNALTVTLQEFTGLFAQGKGAMAPGPAQVYGFFGHTAFPIKAFAFPGPTAAQTRVGTGSEAAWAVTSEASDKSAAEAFMSWLAQPAQQKKWAALNGVVSPSAAIKGVLPSYMASLAPYFKSGKLVPYINALWPNSTIWNDLGKGVEGLLGGQATNASILKQLDSDWALGSS